MRLLLVTTLVLFLACATTRESASERQVRLNADKARAAQLLETERYDEAMTLLVELSREATGDAQLFIMLGDAHAGLDDFAPAVAAYEQSVRLAYSNYESHLKLATLLVRHRKTGRALTEFELAVEYGASEPLTHYNYGLALYEMGRREEAVEQWREARRKAPSDPKYAEAHGIGLSGHDDEAAAAAFADARGLGADSPVFHNNFGLALQRLDRFGEASAEFNAAVAGDPGAEEFRFNVAALYLRTDQMPQAADAFDKLRDDFGDRWSYRVYRAKALQAAGENESAVALLDSVASRVDNGEIGKDAEFLDRVPPSVAEAFEILALARRGLDNGAEALRLIERAVALDSANTSHLNNYGVILAENGMIPRAKEQWRKVLKIDARNATARRNLSHYTP